MGEKQGVSVSFAGRWWCLCAVGSAMLGVSEADLMAAFPQLLSENLLAAFHYKTNAENIKKKTHISF